MKRASTKREVDHQVYIAARQQARLRFFRKREVAAWRQIAAYQVPSEPQQAGHGATKLLRSYRWLPPETKAIVEAVRTQQNRNRRLGIA